MSDIFDINANAIDDQCNKSINYYTELDSIEGDFALMRSTHVHDTIKLDNNDLTKLINICPGKFIKAKEYYGVIYLYHRNPIENYSGIKFDTSFLVYIPNKLNKNIAKNLKVNCSCFEIDKNDNYVDDYHSSIYMENCDITTKDYRINYPLFNINLKNSTINTKNVFVCYYNKFFVSKLDKWYDRNIKIEFKDILNKFNLGFLSNNDIEILSFYSSSTHNLLDWFIVRNDCMEKIMTFKEHPSIDLNNNYKLVLGKLI